jgi:predicted AAA+ superfamily ATPase
MGDENINNLVSMDPQYALAGEHPHLVDEWQDVPKLWDIAKKNVDFSSKKGMYIFTGSTVPPLEKTSHTGIGRFARLHMRTMSLFESGDSNGSVSLSSIFDTGRTETVRSEMGYSDIVRLICRGGWPGALGLDDAEAIDISYEYIKSVIGMDLSRVDGKRRSRTTTELILRSLGRNNATSAGISTIASDIRGAGTDISNPTVSSYIDVLKKLFVIDEQDGWHPSVRSKTRIRTTPKRHLADPSLAAAAMRAGPDILQKDTKTTGFLFESLCYRDLSVYASAL